MAKAHTLYVGILTALALCKHSRAEWNATEESACHPHGNRVNCTELHPALIEPTKETGQWDGHFSKCPKELRHYCVHGECRYIQEQMAPSCRCKQGYTGSRCEYVDLDWLKAEQRQVVIICVIAGLVLLILLIVFICLCSHRRPRLCCRRRGRRRRAEEETRNGTEKLHMMDGSGTRDTSTPDSAVRPHTNAV